MPDPTLTLHDVTKTYAGPSGDIPVLTGVSLTLAAGDSCAIEGPSGSGKSTLLHLMGALDTPTSGTVTLCGRDLSALSMTELADVRNRQVGFVFQDHCLLPQCTVLENTLVPGLAQRRPDPELLNRAHALLDRVGLAARSAHFPAALSGGECQRVAVVRALIREPAIVLADEPTGSPDVDTAMSIVDLLQELNREAGTTLVMVTHAPALASRMQRRYRLESGALHEALT